MKHKTIYNKCLRCNGGEYYQSFNNFTPIVDRKGLQIYRCNKCGSEAV